MVAGNQIKKMTERTMSRCPRRKQAVLVQYEFGDDCDGTFRSDTPACKVPSKPDQSSAPKPLLRFKIRNSNSSKAYVECTSQERVPNDNAGTGSFANQPVQSSPKKYKTFPRLFKVKAVRHAQEHGIERAAEHFAVPPSKIRTWLRVFAKAQQMSTHYSLRKRENRSQSLYAAAFKLFVVKLADERGARAAAVLLSLDEGKVKEWSCLKEDLVKQADGCPQWETDVFVGIRRDLLAGHEVCVEDLLDRARTLKVDDMAIGMEWMRRWCARFNVSFKESQKEVSGVTQLQLPREPVNPSSEREERQVNEKALPKKRDIPRLSRGSTKIDFELWKWCKNLEGKGKKMTKAVVCARAHHVFHKHGYTDFRAGDGWYRAWKSRCQVLDSARDFKRGTTDEHTGDASSDENVHREAEGGNDAKERQEEVKECANLSAPLSLLMDCDSGSGPHEVKAESTVCEPCFPFEDCSRQGPSIASFHESFLSPQFTQTGREHADGRISALPYVGSDDYEAGPGLQKKKNERYLPEFKLRVVKYALQTTFKKTAERFGVHHSTVAEWCRDRKRLGRLFPQEKETLSKGSGESPAGSSLPERAFLEWLRDCNASGRRILPTDVKNKVKEIVNRFGEDGVESTCRWLYIWHKKRLEMQQMIEEDVADLSESGGKQVRIAFPPAVKLEIVQVAERQKFSDTAKCFQIDRNSLSDWSKARTKLRAMVKEGKVRKKEVSKSPKALEAEIEVFRWYQECRSNGFKPRPQEVRAVAAETYRRHGDTNMKCSIGWYSRWSRRFGIQLRYEKDEEILEWVLTQLEQNRTITHHDIQVRAIEVLSQTRADFKCSAGWPIRFCKRHRALLQQQPKLDTPLPAILEEKVNSFRKEVQQLQERHSFTNAAIGAMDEIPLCFTSPVSGGGMLLIRRCGFESAHAVVLLSCLADGAILPPLVLLKASDYNESMSCGFVLHREDVTVDASTVDYWAAHVWSRYVPSPSLLLLDCFDPHVEFAAFASEVKVAVVPGGCTLQLHPIVVWLRRKFQALVQSAWLQSGSTRTLPSPRETLDCITAAWQQLQSGAAQDAVRKSFTVTGAVLAADHSEDHLLGMASLLPEVEEVDIASLLR